MSSTGQPLRLAYADPPYPGKAHLYPENTEVDHVELVAKLCEYDGWALSTDETALSYVLSICPPKVRVLAWCKTDAPPMGGGPWQSWEPVILKPARWREAKVRSFYVGPAPPRGWIGKGFTGSKPAGFCEWVLRCLGAHPEDRLDDLFPGSGAMGAAWDRFRSQPTLWGPPPKEEGNSTRFNRLRRWHPQLPGMPDPVVTRERRKDWKDAA